MGSTMEWRKKVDTMLRTSYGDIQEGPWNPYHEYSTTESLKKFYSGHDMPPKKLRFRERFARWAIEEANKEYLPGKFKVTGEVMQAEMVSYQAGSGSSKSVPKEVMDAIRADGQQDVDAEDPNPPTKKESGDFELVQSIGGAAQALVSGSPNSLGFPIEACATYLQMEKCSEYGRNKLNVWRSPLFPKLTNTNGSKGFLDNQVTAIPWIMSRFLGELPKLKKHETQYEIENRRKLRGPLYSGAILADSMGLGKTLTAIACLDLMARKKLNVQEDAKTGDKRHYPMLIICPNMTVAAQWIEEFLQSTSPQSIKKIIVGGGSRELYPEDLRVRHLSADEFEHWPRSFKYVWNAGDKRASKTVLIMSIDTWSRRTCRVKEPENEWDEPLEWYLTFTVLGRHFSVVCVDEAHKVKNASTRNWKSIGLLSRVHTLLITATLCLNTLTDLLGLARMLWDTPRKYLEDESAETWAQIDNMHSLQDLKILDNVEAWDDLQLAAGRPSLLSRLLCKGWNNIGQDISKTREYLRFFESLAILRRGSGSFLFEDWERTRPVALEGLFPVVDNWTVNIEFDPTLAEEYQAVHIDLLIKYLKALNALSRNKKGPKTAGSPEAKQAISSINSIYRKWQIASASMDVFKLSERLEQGGFGTLRNHISKMRSSGITFLQLAEFLRGPDDPKPETALDYLKLAVRGSPILRYILHDIKENVLRPEATGDIKKLLITEAVPILAYYYELVLQFLGIHCRTFHADLSQDQRKELITSFNSKHPDTCQVLIQMYTVGYAGSNLHKCCARVIVASQAHSLAVQSQAVHRVIRVGQTKDVKVYRLKVDNSFHAFRENLPPDADDIHTDKKRRRGDGDPSITVSGSCDPQAEESEESLDAETELLGAFGDTNTERPFNIARPAERGGSGWFNDCHPRAAEKYVAAAFLHLMPRAKYYGEFKILPSAAKAHFDHKKNHLRRLLSYHHEKGKTAWTLQDLANPAVLERAIELMLRVRLGAGHIEMLPLPQIDFPTVPKETQTELHKLIANCVITAQDADAAQEQMEGKKVKDGIKLAMKGVSSSKSLRDIDEVFKKEERFGGVAEALKIKARRYSKKEDPDTVEGVLMKDIPLFVDSTTTSIKPEKHDGDDEPAEGEDDTWNVYGHPEALNFTNSEAPKPSPVLNHEVKNELADLRSINKTHNPSRSMTPAPVKLRRKIKREYNSDDEESEDSYSYYLQHQWRGDDEGDKLAKRKKEWGPPPKVRHYDSDISDTDDSDGSSRSDSENTDSDIEITTSHPREILGDVEREPTPRYGNMNAPITTCIPTPEKTASRGSHWPGVAVKLEPDAKDGDVEAGGVSAAFKYGMSRVLGTRSFWSASQPEHGRNTDAKNAFSLPESNGSPFMINRGVKREPDEDTELSCAGSRKVPRTDRSTRSPSSLTESEPSFGIREDDPISGMSSFDRRSLSRPASQNESVIKREPSWENEHDVLNTAVSTNGLGTFPSLAEWSFDDIKADSSSETASKKARKFPIIDLIGTEITAEPGWKNGTQKNDRNTPIIDLTGSPIKLESDEVSDSDELEFICSRAVNTDL